MEIGNIVKIIMAIGAMIGVAKIIYELSSSSKLKLREEYKFAKEFLADLDEETPLHHLAVERGYYALAGTSSIQVSDIKYLISLSNPDKSLKDYALSRKYVELNKKLHKIDFRSKYQRKFSRVWRKSFYVLIYVMASLLAMSPLLLAAPFNLGPKFMLLALVTIPGCGFFAFDALRSCMKIMRGEALVKGQEKHVPLIIVKNEKKLIKN
ncbi:hypothetical protein PSH97_21700 [Pseudomonas cucumis]|uniref:Uncharacterized protein n=1 Tax=Pseudomonas cucumis TaxID=2954082 RepID=A0ABY9EUN0_9PSED|nr:hypothetical protein [Pseudomonas cucumis]WLG83691.1 hypothetical protein PSH97_21700 [Pseudomonas cucumis]